MPHRLRWFWVSFGVLVAVCVACLAALHWQAPLSFWAVDSKEVAAELARREADGDPVQAERLSWEGELAGVPWRELGSEAPAGHSVLEDPAELDAAVRGKFNDLQRLAYTSAEFEELAAAIDAAALWTLDADGLAARWDRLDWMQRDPVRIALATDADLIDLQIRAWAMLYDNGDPCLLARPEGLERFHADRDAMRSSGTADEQSPDFFWVLAQAACACAALELAAISGDDAAALRAARDFECLLDRLGQPTNLAGGLGQLYAFELQVRQVEAGLPVLGPSVRGELLELAGRRDAPVWRSSLASVLRFERAFLHEWYSEMVTWAGSGTSWWRGALAGRPLHGEYLAMLKGYDELLEALQLPTYAQVNARLAELDRERDVTRGRRSRMVATAVPRATSIVEQAVRVEALRRCALVAQAQLAGGLEAARAEAELLRDPFDEARLRTRLRDDGVFEVWSVGPDLVDDGGATAMEPGGEDLDVVLRVPVAPR